MIKELKLENKPEKDLWEVADDFMEKLIVGDAFQLNDKKYQVKSIGVWKSQHFGDRKFKTLTLQSCKNENIKFFYFFGYGGNPKTKSLNASIKQHDIIRKIEGQLLVDFINYNNPFHKKSDIYNIANR